MFDMLVLGPLRGQNVSCLSLGPVGVKTLHDKPGPLEGSKCLMLCLGPWRLGPLEGSKCFIFCLGPSTRGENLSCSARVKMFHIKAGPLEWSKCFMLSLGASRLQNVGC